MNITITLHFNMHHLTNEQWIERLSRMSEVERVELDAALDTGDWRDLFKLYPEWFDVRTDWKDASRHA